MFQVVLIEGWLFFCKILEPLLVLLSPSLSASVIFSTVFARKMCCVLYTEVHTHRSFTLPGWHCSVTFHCMMKGCVS